MNGPVAGISHWIERLLRPEAYPHAVVEPIRLAETHISWVLLTGPYAYKIKKPLRLSFLDYSSLDRRRFFCDEEVRLNGRYAPDLYLGVSAIAGPPEAPRVDGTGPALEYAVRMRQFEPREELDALVAAGAAGVGELEEFGGHVARFHSGAAHADPASDWGRPETVHRVIRDNFSELARLPEAGDLRSTIADLRQWVDETHERLGPCIARRRDEGQVRECHGDLHCGNVVRWRGRLTPFDGIEFDPALRYVDVVNDMAFLTMDLAVRGRPDLRRAALQSWVESLGDFDGLRLLPYFEAYRALVRAKVAALRALQESNGSPDRARDCDSVGTYLQWALRRTKQVPRGLWLTCGLSGSGKTWLAQSLIQSFDALHVRSDVERKRLAGLGPLDDSLSAPDAGIYTREFTRRTYDRLHDCAESAIEGGEAIVVDAAYLRRDERTRMLGLARRLGVPFAILHCVAPIEVLHQRVEERSQSGRDASEAGVALLDRQPGFWEDFGPDERPAVVTIDTTAPDAAERAAEALRSLGGA
jgi:aminoglycoside phosphotransferase family enzyme/predicted kinase